MREKRKFHICLILIWVSIGILLLNGFMITSAVAVTPATDHELLIVESPSIESFLLYSAQVKEPAKAVVYSLIIPSLGHAYAGNWSRGLLFTGAQAVEAFFVLALPDEPIGAWALIALIGTKAWELIDSYKTTERYNAVLRNELALDVRQGLRGQKNLVFTYHF